MKSHEICKLQAHLHFSSGHNRWLSRTRTKDNLCNMCLARWYSFDRAYILPAYLCSARWDWIPLWARKSLVHLVYQPAEAIGKRRTRGYLDFPSWRMASLKVPRTYQVIRRDIGCRPIFQDNLSKLSETSDVDCPSLEWCHFITFAITLQATPRCSDCRCDSFAMQNVHFNIARHSLCAKTLQKTANLRPILAAKGANRTMPASIDKKKKKRNRRQEYLPDWKYTFICACSSQNFRDRNERSTRELLSKIDLS